MEDRDLCLLLFLFCFPFRGILVFCISALRRGYLGSLYGILTHPRTYSVVDGQNHYVGAQALKRHSTRSILRYQRPTRPKDPYSTFTTVGVLPSEHQSGACPQITHHVTKKHPTGHSPASPPRRRVESKESTSSSNRLCATDATGSITTTTSSAPAAASSSCAYPLRTGCRHSSGGVRAGGADFV